MIKNQHRFSQQIWCILIFRRVVLLIALTFSLLQLNQAAGAQSIARMWDERALAAIRVDTPHPPAQARNYFSLSVCMYDAWAAYDSVAVGYVYRNKHTATDVAAARREAISYAAYRLLKERHVYSRTAATTLAADDAFMASLGYDTNNISRDVSTPAGVGNAIYDAVSAWFINDGANQAAGIPYPQADPPVAYPDYAASAGGYIYLNPPLAVSLEGISDGKGNTTLDVDHWQRLQIVNSVDQNGFPQGPIQPYLGAQWLKVRAFSLIRADATKPWIDPGPPPFFGGASHSNFVKQVVACITADSQLDPTDGAMMDISPASLGNNSLDFEGEFGTGEFQIYDGHGYATNPITGKPYTPEIVPRGDYARLVAEFWADGPSSETPPGHWNVLANYVTDQSLLVKKIGGGGPVVDDLEWDVKLYFALNAAVHDAACACWGTKRYYDAWRPISAIRYMAGLGQSSNPGLPSYNPLGLPLITNLIELVTPSTAAVGGRHQGLVAGKIAVRAWPGPPEDPVNQISKVKWIHGDYWSSYQRTNFVTPAFPGYFSGHSTFSRAAAEVLSSITGSPYFPGGLGTYTNFHLGFEKGPSVPVAFQWATYYDAADEAGISRIWGGIHPPVDNLIGRRVASQVGKQVWALAKSYWDGSILGNTPSMALRKLLSNQHEVSFTTQRGFYYQVQSAAAVDGVFQSESTNAIAYEGSMSITNTSSDPQKFYRVKSAPKLN